MVSVSTAVRIVLLGDLVCNVSIFFCLKEEIVTEKYQEPTGQETAGHLTQIVLPSAYDVFMEEQKLPIHRGIGVHDIRELPLAPLSLMGGQGTFLELDGHLWGMYLVEVPAGGVLKSERHIYEETFIIIEGRGSIETWR